MTSVTNKFGKIITVGDKFTIRRDIYDFAEKCEVIGFTPSGSKVIVRTEFGSEQKFSTLTLRRKSFYLSEMV